MSNNAPDYEDNLFFEPKEIEQKLAHSEKMRDYTAEYVAKLEEKLRIAEQALEFYANKENNLGGMTYWNDLDEQCAFVDGDIENGYKARQALAKIKE